VGAAGKNIKVLIVDDHRTFGEALKAALTQEKDLEIVDVVTDGTSAVESAAEHHPDVVLMDVSMPGGVDGIEATRRIKEAEPDARIVMMTGHENELLLGKAVQAGASGYLGKTEAITIVAESVRVVYRGDPLLDEAEVEQALRALRHRRAQEGSIERRLDRLTPREVEILQRLAQGMSNDQIATDLGMSPHTLRTHIQNILTKLGVHSKLEALVFAIRHGKVAAAG
jgi:DNA-binding NarL/FixJ family response regulator